MHTKFVSNDIIEATKHALSAWHSPFVEAFAEMASPGKEVSAQRTQIDHATLALRLQPLESLVEALEKVREKTGPIAEFNGLAFSYILSFWTELRNEAVFTREQP